MNHSTSEQALDRLLGIAALLGDDMDRELAAMGLNRSRAHLIFVLNEHGPATQSQLASTLRLAPRTITTLVDGLTDSGFVTRETHPSDRRAVLVTLTAPGETTAATLTRGRLDLARQLFDPWTRHDLDELVESLDRITGSLQTTLHATGLLERS